MVKKVDLAAYQYQYQYRYKKKQTKLGRHILEVAAAIKNKNTGEIEHIKGSWKYEVTR
jgi:hypothetical protein